MPYFEKEIQLERLSWFINLRWAAVVGGILILFTGPLAVPVNIDYGKLFLCVGLLALLNGAYFLYWRKVQGAGLPKAELEKKAGRLLHLQMIVDFVLLTAMIAFSGGAENPIFLFYLFHLAISVMVFPMGISLFYSVPALALPWALHFLEPLNLSSQAFWRDNTFFMRDHEITLLFAYSVTVAGLWFFISRLSSDIDKREGKLIVATEQLRQANEQLNQLETYKNHFIKQVVYQLKTPAINIDFDLSTLEKALTKPEEKVTEALQEAKKRIWALLELIDDLTWLSKVGAEDVPFKKEWVDVYATLLKKVQILEPEAARRGIAFKLHGDPKVVLRADHEGFERVVDNLLSNALKYTPEGQHAVVVEILQEGDWLVVAFDDEGIGIPPKQQEKLFQEFFRATNAKTLEKFGTGLGLAIVKRVLDWHGGKIVVHSEPKEGTRVETWWPYSAE